MTDGREGRDLVAGDLMSARQERRRRLVELQTADEETAASEPGVLDALPAMPPADGGDVTAGELAEGRPVGSLPAQETAGGAWLWAGLVVALALVVIMVRLLSGRKGSHG